METNYNHDIAVIGMSGRFPGAKNLDQFWQNIQNSVESISFFSTEELSNYGIKEKLINNPSYVKASAAISDIDMFDANFFEYSPRESEEMDPQQRLFLECAWEAIENGGYDPNTYEGLIGIYAGVGINTYILNNLYSNYDFSEVTSRSFEQMLANDKDYLATRAAYKLNLTGPAVNIQTACSTSLVAVHIACQSLLNGECDMALAGGVSIQVPQAGYLYQEGMILSPDGHCRAFDARAKGTVPGNGIGIVLLKGLEDAIADGDFIYAIIKGSAVNNDGSFKLGYTAPSVEGQSAVIAEAQAIAGVDVESITYIEAHGTGTELGDPMEIEALKTVFQQNTQKKGFCAIGSLKTNMGHLNTAAGVAGLIKTVLALKHKLLPPSLNFEQPNPQIDFANSPFYVNTTLSEWKSNGTPRRAGVSSFGVGGTNVHAVLEEAPPEVKTEEISELPVQLLTLSAKTDSALTELVARYITH
ncbi:MAG: polyketide synthase, partial [Moorea sp. SIO3G5]|nr:polyketide synthase [Moorena sp. SIO3G5]